MGLFSDAGRTFEKTKRALTGSGQAEYVCTACETAMDDDHEYCPHCGEAAVEPVE